VQSPCLEYEIVLQPWEQDSRSLISWFDMLNFSARQFFYCGGALRDIRQDAILSAARCPDGSEGGFNPSVDIDHASRVKALAHLKGIEPQFRTIGLEIAADTVSELISELGKDRRQSVQWLIDHVDAIEKIAEKELKRKAFFYIPPERIKFWPKMNEPYAFGKKVADSFPSSTSDGNNAGLCLAASFSIAAVFHLMRVLEIGLSVLGSEFGISLAHTNWAPAIEQIESKIRDMHKDPKWKALPDCKEQQEFYAQAASHFGILKDAWRNHAMHVRGKYTQNEAELIFENVKAFMRKLSEKLDENLILVPPVTPP
jgi:hypothetical protein